MHIGIAREWMPNWGHSRMGADTGALETPDYGNAETGYTYADRTIEPYPGRPSIHPGSRRHRKDIYATDESGRYEPPPIPHRGRDGIG